MQDKEACKDSYEIIDWKKAQEAFLIERQQGGIFVEGVVDTKSRYKQE